MATDFRVGDWLVRPQRDRIERGGKAVHVKPKSMAVLECLAQADGEVVGRQVFFDTIWPGGVVTDDVLTQCIAELRRAFGDSARNPQVIETIPKVGFRLIPAVKPVGGDSSRSQAEDVIAPRTRVSLVVISTILMALVIFWYLTGLREIPSTVVDGDSKSIAVLPFVDMSAEGDQGYFADGLSEELIGWLAQLEGLKVAARTSSFYFKDRNEDMRSIADALGVNHLLEGSVRRDGDRLRVSAQLIEARDGFHLWADQYDRPFEDYFTIQEEIAESVASALSIELQVGQLGTIPGGTSSVEAYEEILASKLEQWKSTPDSILRAIEHAKRATEIDPAYARAWARLAGLYVNANALLGTEDVAGAYSESEQALEHARSLAPDLPAVLEIAVHIQIKKGQWSEVEKTLNQGEGLLSHTRGDLIRVYSGFLLRMGRIHEAIPLLERVRSLLPFSSSTARALAYAYVNRGRIEEGFAEAERALELDGFDSWDSENGLHLALEIDDRDLLLKWLERAEHYVPGSQHFFVAMRETLDDHEAALEWLRRTYQQSDKFDYYIAFWAAWHGDTQLALDALRDAPAPMSFWHGVMKEVRQQQGFKELLRDRGLVEYYREYGWNEFCKPVGEDDFVCE